MNERGDAVGELSRRRGRHVLMVTREDLFPANHGGAVKIVRTASALSKQMDSVLVVTGDPETYFVFERGECREEEFPPRLQDGWSSRERAERRLAAIGIPEVERFLQLGLVDEAHLQRALYLAARHDIEFYHAEFPLYAQVCLVAKNLFPANTLLVEHNVEFLRIADQYPELEARAFDWLRRRELEMCHSVDRVVAVSEPDRDALLHHGVPPSKVTVVPHGVDLESYDRCRGLDLRGELGISSDRIILLYHGIYSYAPNLEAVQFLAHEILPLLAERGRRACVVAIGPLPPRERVHEDVLFTGAVDELAPYLTGGADVAVVPLLRGGGTRMKILEYFAARVPVVATSKAVDGIPIRQGTHALIADSAAELARHVLDVVDRPRQREQLTRAGRSFVERLDWSHIARRYIELVGQPAAACAGEETRDRA